MALTPSQRQFLLAAIADNGELRKTRTSLSGKSPRYIAGNVELQERSGDSLIKQGFIEQVRDNDGKAVLAVVGWHNFIYRITDAGRKEVS